jgi:acetyl esterase
VDPARVGVGGDSAGGNLAASVALTARDRGGPALRHQLLVYPVTDHRLDTPSYRENADGPVLTRDMMAAFWDYYVPDAAQRAHAYVSPLRAEDLSGLPRALVVTAEYDPLRDEGEAYAARLREAGVPVAVRRYDGMMHGFLAMGDAIDRAREAMADTAAELRDALCGEP